jgi:hypothetical protein
MGRVQGLPVIVLSLREVIADPVQRPFLVERLGLTTPFAEVAVDGQGLLVGLGRGRVITGQPPYDPQVAEGAGLAEPVTHRHRLTHRQPQWSSPQLSGGAWVSNWIGDSRGD